MGRGGWWLLLDESGERIAGSSSNWNPRRTKSVFHVCVQLLPKGGIHLLPPPPLYCPWPPSIPTPPSQEHKSLIAPETAIPTNDCVSSTRLTTLHLTIYQEGGDTCTLGLITAQWHQWKLPIPALSGKSEAGGILRIPHVGGRGRPSEISLRKKLSATQTALTRPSFHPPLPHLT